MAALHLLFSSNTVTASIIVPILVALAHDLKLNVWATVAPAAFTSSLAFILVSEGPTTIIPYSSGYFSIRDMARAGIVDDRGGGRMRGRLGGREPMARMVMAAQLPRTSTGDVRAALRAGTEIALIDVREEGVFAEAHPLFAASLPLGRLELEVLDRVPRLDTPIVLYDDGEGLVAAAGRTLRSLGYTRVSQLDGGLAGWSRDGGEVFRDVNSPSKAFGELVEAQRHTPSIAARDLRRLLDEGADLVVLDARREEEYRTMSVPGGLSAPGAELVRRVGAAAPAAETLVVVNCAGRTRSIIGAQSLINAGVPNRVVALRNGTIGWTLEGLALEHGQTRRAPVPSPEQEADARRAARAVADRGRRAAARSRGVRADAGRHSPYDLPIRRADARRVPDGQSNVIHLALSFLSDKLVFFVMPNELFDIQWRRSLHVTPAVTPVLHIVGHLNRVLLRSLFGKLRIEQALERR